MKKLYIFIHQFGINPIQFLNSIRFIGKYFTQLIPFLLKSNKKFRKDIFPILSDRYSKAGSTNLYFKQDLLVAQKIFKLKPKNHLDVGSRIDGLVGNLATFMAVDVIDIRPLESPFPEINFIQNDMMGSVVVTRNYDSITCLHALEHFGLGRYGDPINFEGHITGLKNIVNYLKPSGTLYLSVPIGRNTIHFNAHRVFSINYLVNLFEEIGLKIKEFDYIDDKGKIFRKVKISDGQDDNFGCRYGCGILTLQIES